MGYKIDLPSRQEHFFTLGCTLLMVTLKHLSYKGTPHFLQAFVDLLLLILQQYQLILYCLQTFIKDLLYFTLSPITTIIRSTKRNKFQHKRIIGLH